MAAKAALMRLVVGWGLLVALFAGMSLAAGRAGLLPELYSWSPLLLLTVVVLAGVLPTGRSLGGCQYGCALCFLAVFGLGVGAWFFPKGEQLRPLPAEAIAAPRWLKGVTPTLDGIALDTPATAVVACLGRATSMEGNLWRYPGTTVQLREGVVTMVRGQVLAQGGRELVRGPSRAQATRVFMPGALERDIFRMDGYTFTIGTDDGEIEMSRGEPPHRRFPR